jgi:hypothetical protein
MALLAMSTTSCTACRFIVAFEAAGKALSLRCEFFAGSLCCSLSGSLCCVVLGHFACKCLSKKGGSGGGLLGAWC